MKCQFWTGINSSTLSLMILRLQWNPLRRILRHMCSNMSREQVIEQCVPLAEVKRFVIDCMKRVGAVEGHAVSLADILATADYRGHYSHGLNRLDMYMRDVTTGTTISREDTNPDIVKETVATALVDGNNILGSVVGDFCMRLAIEKAQTVGIGWVSARNSNHYGICATYTRMATSKGLIGMSFTNTSPLCAPTRSKVRTLGTNPLSITAPGNHGDDFELDMATTAVAWGKIEIADRRAEKVPEGWGVTEDGKDTDDPSLILEGGSLLPLGSKEERGSYKGYGLTMAVEVLTSVLSGGNVGPNVRSWKSANVQANLGQTFVALDPGVFAEGFSDRLAGLMDHCRDLEPIEGCEPVMVAGDPERKHMALCEKNGGIPYHPNQVSYANQLAQEYGVKPLEVLVK